MTDLRKGLATLHFRAESWECDIHRHWSTRFYCRSFDEAARSCALLTGQDPDPSEGLQRHIRFHREILEGDAVEIRTYASRKAEPESIVHCMLRGGVLLATARDEVAQVPDGLPELPQAWEALASVRGLRGAGWSVWQPDENRDFLSVLGPVTAADLGGAARGRVPFEELFRRCSFASLHHISEIGFSADFTRSHHMGRMVAEMRFQAFGEAAVGDLIQGASRLTHVTEKSFVTSHQLSGRDGSLLGIFDFCSLAVDLNTRRACALPEFLRQSEDCTV